MEYDSRYPMEPSTNKDEASNLNKPDEPFVFKPEDGDTKTVTVTVDKDGENTFINSAKIRGENIKFVQITVIDGDNVEVCALYHTQCHLINAISYYVYARPLNLFSSYATGNLTQYTQSLPLHV